MKYKGVTINNGKYYILLKSKYYGSCEDEEIAGKIFDVISVYNNFEAVNFPDENLICEYENIYEYINLIRKNNNRHICEDLKNKIKYKYKNE